MVTNTHVSNVVVARKGKHKAFNLEEEVTDQLIK
jgi:hypothetical protein